MERDHEPTADSRAYASTAPHCHICGHGSGASSSRKRKAPHATTQKTTRQDSPLGEVDRPADILFIMHELSQVLQSENEALIHHNHAAVHDIMERKQSLTRAYLEHMVTLHRNPDLLHTFPPDRTDEIKHVGAQLDAISQQNEALLKAEITAANMFIGAVTDAVRGVKGDAQSSYSDTGRLDGTHAENRRLAIALNKEF